MAILSKNTFTYRPEQIHAFLLIQHELTRSRQCVAITQHNFLNTAGTLLNLRTIKFSQ
jgi:hypothetical protein